MDSLTHLQQQLGYTFHNQQLLAEALTHRSYGTRNNERLEFLGDAVLDLLVGEYLFERFPHADEGSLSKMRSSLVNEKSLAMFARTCGIGNVLRLSQAEDRGHGRKKDSLLSNAFEAIIGAIYRESNLHEVRKILARILDTHYPNMRPQDLQQDYKSTLQEITQERFHTLPIYTLISQEGPDHKKRFTIQVSIHNIPYGTASGSSKKLAEQACAKLACDKLALESSQSQPI